MSVSLLPTVLLTRLAATSDDLDPLDLAFLTSILGNLHNHHSLKDFGAIRWEAALLASGLPQVDKFLAMIVDCVATIQGSTLFNSIFRVPSGTIGRDFSQLPC